MHTAADFSRIWSERNVDIDVECAKCGYNLRTLHTLASCPECGELVSTSLVVAQCNVSRIVGNLGSAAIQPIFEAMLLLLASTISSLTLSWYSAQSWAPDT